MADGEDVEQVGLLGWGGVEEGSGSMGKNVRILDGVSRGICYVSLKIAQGSVLRPEAEGRSALLSCSIHLSGARPETAVRRTSDADVVQQL